jgi:hypothetical protein
MAQWRRGGRTFFGWCGVLAERRVSRDSNFSPESLGGGSVRMILTVADPDAVFCTGTDGWCVRGSSPSARNTASGWGAWLILSGITGSLVVRMSPKGLDEDSWVQPIPGLSGNGSDTFPRLTARGGHSRTPTSRDRGSLVAQRFDRIQFRGAHRGKHAAAHAYETENCGGDENGFGGNEQPNVARLGMHGHGAVQGQTSYRK